MRLDSFDYDLPPDRIAQQAAEPRHSARLLVDDGPGQAPRDLHVSDLPGLLEPGDLLVVNDTRVIPARLRLRRVSGAAVELLVLEEVQDRRWEALVRPSRRVRPGDVLRTEDGGIEVHLDEALGEGRWTVSFGGSVPVLDLLGRHGQLPLPPYLTGPLTDPGRYQTVFARRPASVAAPTAGLHLSEEVLARVAARGVGLARIELVVGLGTFRPITVEQVEDHRMHTESYRIPPESAAAIEAAPRVVAVGTTVVRALESWGATGRTEGRTDLFIRRGHRFAHVDALLTNFHVPRSSLLVLVDAFVGPRWRDLYAHALTEGYRFLSLGDAMFLPEVR